MTSASTSAMLTELNSEAVNDRPIIGILTQLLSSTVMEPYGSTHIPTAYVKFIEAGGARVMPISPAKEALTLGNVCHARAGLTPKVQCVRPVLTHTTAEYEDIFRKINGLVFIGGRANFTTSEMARVAKIFYQLAKEANDAGDYFPIWGTCWGMQYLAVLEAGEYVLKDTKAQNIILPLDLTTEASSSKMFKDFPCELMRALTTEPLTGNFHYSGVTVEDFQENEKLRSFFSVLSTNVSEDGVNFVSTIEGKNYPFYGVQWHPEVNCFQWDQSRNFPHSRHAVQLASLLSQFFCNEGRKNLHQFDNPEEEAASLIYNYNPVYALGFSGYEQVYFF